MDDENIIALYIQRSEQAIHQTDIKYGRFCASLSRNIVKNWQDAQECVNDTYLRAWYSIPPTIPQNLPAWLARIVRNLSINRVSAATAKKRGSVSYTHAFDELSDMIPGPLSVEDTFNEIHLRQCLQSWLSGLPREHRLVFLGRYWYFDSVSDIAVRMGFSVSKTKMLLSRLRADLRGYLEKEEIL